MDKGERCRVKCLAGESAGSFVVEGIAEQRMADVSHVDADLVGAAGFEIEFEVGENGAVREGAVMGYGALAGGKVDGALDEGAVEAGDRASMVPDAAVRRGRRLIRAVDFAGVHGWERTAALKACLASTIRPVVSRSRRLIQR